MRLTHQLQSGTGSHATLPAASDQALGKSLHPQSQSVRMTVLEYATRFSTLACMLSPQSHCSRAKKVEAVLLSSM